MKFRQIQLHRNLSALQLGIGLAILVFGFTWWLTPAFVAFFSDQPGILRLTISFGMSLIVLTMILLYRLRANHKKLQAFLDSVTHITDLSQAQLANTKGVTETAIISIIRGLDAVVAEAARLISALDAGKMRAASLYDNAQVLVGESRQRLAEINSYRRQFEQKIQEEKAAIQGVVTEVEKLKSMTSLIREAVKQANLLAVNGAIEAARVGEAGRGFAVIANEIRKLSGQIETAAIHIEGGVDQVARTVNEQLVEAIAKGIEDETKWLVTATSSMNSVSGDFQTSVGELNGLSLSTQEVVSSIRDAIIEVLKQVQFQDITSQQIEHVQSGLAMCSELIKTAEQGLAGGEVNALDINQLDGVMETLRKNYTMQSQHATHQNVVGGQPAMVENDRPAIEIF